MKLPPDIETWVKKTWHRREAVQVLSHLSRLNTERQVREVHAYLANLARNRKTLSTVQDVLRPLVRMATLVGSASLAPPSQEVVRAWANTPAWPQYPRAGTKLHETRMRPVSASTRREQMKQLSEYVRFHLIRQRVTTKEAEEQARNLVYQDGLIDLPKGRPRKRTWLKEEHRVKMLAACPKIRLPALHKATATYLIQILPHTRGTPFLRTARKHLRIEGDLATVDVPRGYRNKKTVTLYHNRDQTNALLHLLSLHPKKDDPNAPLLPDPWQASKGVCAPMHRATADRLIRRACGKAKLPYYGVQSFRRLGHNQAAASGDSDRDMRLKFAHSPMSQMGMRYTKLGLEEVVQIMDELQGKPTKGRYCTRCRGPHGLADQACRHCGHPLRNANTIPLDADQLRLELGAELALAED